MSVLTINLISALAVSGIITSMSKVHSQKLKAILYTLPFPITIALIGSNSIATSLSILGLMLTTGFLWGCYLLHIKQGMKILHADVLLSILYIIGAYFLTKSVEASFWAMLVCYGLPWLVLIVFFKKLTFEYRAQASIKTNAWFKAATVFVIAFGLFSMHQYLAAFVVTFPYNGVFAVYENKAGLLPQAVLFTRNSIALVAYFVANYLVGEKYSDILRYVASWLAFGIVLILVNRVIKLRIRDVSFVQNRTIYS